MPYKLGIYLTLLPQIESIILRVNHLFNSYLKSLKREDSIRRLIRIMLVILPYYSSII
jgi:hypothetical protein